MDLRRIRTFVTVADHGTVSAAAQILHIAQPALSRQLQELRDEFGVALFEQVGRRLRLTTEGADLLPACRHLLGQAEGVLDHARTLSEGDSGELRVGATPHTIASFFPRFLPRFQRAFPRVRLRTVEAGGYDQWDMLRRGDLHAAVTLLEGRESGFIAHTLPPLVQLVAYRPGGALALPDAPDLADLAGHPLLLLRPGYGTRRVFDAACRMARISPTIVLESASPETLLALAGGGQGIAIVPSTARITVRGLRLVPLHHQGAVLHMEAAVLWNGERRLPRYAPAFNAMMADAARTAMARWLPFAPEDGGATSG